MKQRLIHRIQKRKIIIFFRCLLISLIAWLLIAVSNTYTLTVKAAIEYVNIPEKRAFHPLQSDTVAIKVKMSGWNILISKLNTDTSQVKVDLSSLSNRNFIVFSNQIGFINRQFALDKQVIAVSPDTLYFDFSKQTQRKVKVRVPTNIAFKKQYGIIGETNANPAYVTITGPTDDVADIEFIDTDSIISKQVHTDIRTVVNFNKNNRTNISIYPKFTEVVIPVGELTEKLIDIPIRIVNSTKYSSVRTIPGKVTITAIVSLKDYTKLTASDFEALVDVSQWETSHVKSLPVILTKIPEFVKVVKIEPQNVDFFVRK